MRLARADRTLAFKPPGEGCFAVEKVVAPPRRMTPSFLADPAPAHAPNEHHCDHGRWSRELSTCQIPQALMPQGKSIRGCELWECAK
jgi:hypothetical protein